MRWKSRLLCSVVLALGGLLAFASAARCGGAEIDPLGAIGAGPSPARPFGFRGDGSGRFPGAMPTITWSPDKNVRWSAQVGSSYSSPILAGECVIVASEPNLLISLDRATGTERWRLKTTPADVPDASGRAAAAGYEPPKNGSGLTAATPVTDGETIYAVFANGIIRAVGIDGKPRWTMCIAAPPSSAYGRAASPLLVDGRLIVHMTGLYAFDAATGKQLWANDSAKSTYATPLASKLAGDRMIVTPAGDVVRAADGRGVAADIGSTQEASPIADPDGIIYFPGTPISAVQLGADFKDTEIWSGSIAGETFGSPLLLDGALFIVNGDGQLYAFDAKAKGSIDPLIDGRGLVARAPGRPSVFSSLTLAGKYLFLTSNSGETIVMEATRGAKVVAKNQLPAGSGASPVFCGGEMYIRDGEKLLCIGR